VNLVEEGLIKDIFEKSDGAVVYKGEKKGLHTRVFFTSKGTPTYETKELGLNKDKFEKEELDHSIIITATEQSGYFEVVLAAMAEVLPAIAAKTRHVSHGFMQLVGGKMSSREGNVISGESLIEEMRAKAFAKMEGRTFESEEAKEGVADMVAVAAIKYSILKQSSGKNIIFDPEQSLSFEGDSGPYLQYSYVRAESLLKKAESGNLKAENPPPEVSSLERLLPRFPEVVERAGKEYEPHYITTYLTELASAFNSWYAEGRIIGSEHEPYKLALTKAFALSMKNGLRVLGIRVPEAM
jgi:arginyl-tRNA synthetase